jgi:hypothetical protein
MFKVINGLIDDTTIILAVGKVNIVDIQVNFLLLYLFLYIAMPFYILPC